ncbi:MAG: hypothetical protein ACTHMM_16670 [Agriterribacter sp.]
MNELFIYDRDQGLFKEILKHSIVIQGRYHVAAGYGAELNTANIEAYVKDVKGGFVDDPNKYPCCVCMVPKSDLVERNGATWERFIFQLYFLCTTYYTGDNQVKQPDKDTGVSSHHVWYDWKDMKECAGNFMQVLDDVMRKKTVVIDGKESPVGVYFNMDSTPFSIKRLSKFNNDRLSGAGITFVANLYAEDCVLQDYPDDVLSRVVVPPTVIHPIHKH